MLLFNVANINLSTIDAVISNYGNQSLKRTTNHTVYLSMSQNGRQGYIPGLPE